jgi:GH15 family glucan-1,4-alpha-glucosidase
MVSPGPDGKLEVDGACDSSLWGLFAFGVYTPEDPRIAATMRALRRNLWVDTPVGGMSRYENDGYYRMSEDVPGNPWFITTLWLADYLIRSAADETALEEALSILVWAADHALPSGTLAEQLHPHTGMPLSVSPLTWSHATFITVTQRYLRRMAMRESVIPQRTEDWIGKLFGETCDAIHHACEVR